MSEEDTTPMASHSHHHHHHGEHKDGQSNTEKNLAHWDSVAGTYNSTHRQQEFGDLLNKATAFILENVCKIGVDFLNTSREFEASTATKARTIRVLDYACGPGTVTNALLGRANEFIGLDLSPKMVDEYNKRFSSQEGDRVNAKAYQANLLADNPPATLAEPQFFNFDLAAVGLGFHHFDDVSVATQRLTERLKSGGAFMILDFFSHDHDDMAGDAAHGTVSHHGFSEAAVKKLFSDAGLQDIQLVAYPEEVTLKGKARRRMFLAWGIKGS